MLKKIHRPGKAQVSKHENMKNFGQKNPSQISRFFGWVPETNSLPVHTLQTLLFGLAAFSARLA